MRHPSQKMGDEKNEREKEDELKRQMKRDKEELMRRAERQREREIKGRSDDWERKGLGQSNTPDRDVHRARASGIIRDIEETLLDSTSCSPSSTTEQE